MPYAIGVDFGRENDYSTLAVVEIDISTAGLHVVHLRRNPLGTKYTSVVDGIISYLGDERLVVDEISPTLAIDATGVGAAASDMLLDRGASFYSVTVTSGAKSYPYARTNGRISYRVPKAALVAALERPFRQGRLKVAPALRFGPALQEEIRNCRRKITPSARTRYEHGSSSQHDDLLIATALACWSA